MKEAIPQNNLEILRNLTATKSYAAIKHLIEGQIEEHTKAWLSLSVTDEFYKEKCIGIQKSITSLKNLIKTIEKFSTQK